MRSMLFLSALAVLLAGSSLASAGTPCASLKGRELEKYNSLGANAVKLYRDGNFTGAISSLVELRDICDEDPVIVYNLARAYEKSGNCNMSRFWYEEVMARDESTFGALVEAQKVTAAKSIARLEEQCRDSARIVVECEAGATATLGEVLAGACPLKGRVDAGQYALTISAPDKVSVTTDAEVRPGEINRIFALPLAGFVADSAFGGLHVVCGEGLSTVAITNTSGERQELNCGSSGEQPTGDYTASIADRGVDVAFTLAPGSHTELHIVVPAPKEVQLEMVRDDTLLTVGWTFIGVGGGLLAAGAGLHFGAASMRDAYVAPGKVSASGVVESITQKDAQSKEDTAQLFDTIGLASAGVGGALVIGGAIFLLLAEETVEPPQVSLSPTNDGVFLSYRSAW